MKIKLFGENIAPDAAKSKIFNNSITKNGLM